MDAEQVLPPGEEAGGGDWRIYRGDGSSHDGIARLPEPPPWRTYDGGPVDRQELSTDDSARRRLLGGAGQASAYRADENVVRMVNAALYLRRPLLVSGRPGTGKSTLAYSIAYELQLGPVLSWPITSRSTLADGLYRYDALSRLQEANLQRLIPDSDPSAVSDIGQFIRLGPLGTALLPRSRPRVLLIDELDKSDIDLPNDLLHVFETGRYEIDELARLPDSQAPAHVFTADVSPLATGADHRAPVTHGRVTCRAFPIVVITSNGEREFPVAFQRRCMRLTIQPPERAKLAAIVAAQLGTEISELAAPIIARFLDRRGSRDLATDQLLNAIYFATSGARLPSSSAELLEDELMSPLSPVEIP